MAGTPIRYALTFLTFPATFTAMCCGPLLAQAPTRIASDVMCPECSLALEHVVSLGSRDGPGHLDFDSVTVTRDSRGFYYVLQFMEPSSILVFDEAGRFVRRIGQSRRGPYEYRRIESIRVGRGDTLHVYDAGTGRHSVLDPSWEYVTGRPLQLPKVHGVVELENGEEVLNAEVYAPERIGFTLHTLDEEGQPRRSFGDPDTLLYLYGDLPLESWRSITPAGGNRVWVAPPNRYVLELWNSDGTKQAELVREAEWFEAWVERAPPAPDRPYPPMLRAIHVGPGGNLWVAIVIPSEDWAERVAVKFPWGTPARGWLSPEAYDTVIEVISIDEGRIFLSQRIAPKVAGFIDAHYVYASRRDEEHVARIDIWRVRLDIP